MSDRTEADAIVVGGGLAGLVATAGLATPDGAAQCGSAGCPLADV